MADFIIHAMANVITVKYHSSNRLFCEKVIKFAGPFVPLFSVLFLLGYYANPNVFQRIH